MTEREFVFFLIAWLTYFFAYWAMEFQLPNQQPPMPGNHLVLAILSTVLGLLCCCGLNLPFGIVAIVFASQVNGKYASGDFQGAISSAKQAKIWGWISMGLVILALVLHLISSVLSFFFETSQSGLYDDLYPAGTYDSYEYEESDPYDY